MQRNYNSQRNGGVSIGIPQTQGKYDGCFDSELFALRKPLRRSASEMFS
jgi:hypothetical protein